MTDLIVTDALIWTGDPRRPSADALAIEGDRIVAIGGRDEVLATREAATRVVPIGGRRVLPGFIDSHLHIPWGAVQLASVDLKDAASESEFARRIADRAHVAPGDWVQGGGWDEQAWTPAVLPTRNIIDGLTPDTPVFVRRYDVHTALANSVALRLAGVTADTPDPVGGEIVRDANGAPTGVLKDAAMQLVQRVVPAPDASRRLREIRAAIERLCRVGITSVHDMNPSAADVRVYEALASRGQLPLRIYALPLETEWFDSLHDGNGPWTALAHAGPVRAPMVRTGGLKGFADGSLGSATALFFDAYADAPDAHGLLSDEMQPRDAVRDRLIAADAAGLQLCIHAIGDRAVSIVLDLFEDVRRANGPRDRRWRIEHAQHLAPGDFARFASLGVIASVQPYHLVDDGRWAEARIGHERAQRAFAFRTFLDNGVRLTFGTDWPVAPPNPMLTLQAAVTRATLDGRHPDGWIPSQRLSLAEAIDAYTRTAAYAEGAENEKGRLASGMLADLVVLSQDPFAIEPARLGAVEVDVTMVGGRVVHGEL